MKKIEKIILDKKLPLSVNFTKKEGNIMIIDFHTHAFPDKIAKKTIEHLESVTAESTPMHAHTDGTLASLRSVLSKAGVDLAIVMPICTRDGQSDSINRFAEGIRTDGLLSFGSVFPYQSDRLCVLSDLASRGFKGIKLHPEYQNCDIDSDECAEIIKKAEELGMYVTVHAGYDPAYKAPFRCTPEKINKLLKRVSGENLILAHLGSQAMWDGVLDILCGRDIYFDTAALCGHISPEIYKKVIDKHGADKILFASDCPWEDPADSLKLLKSLGLSNEEYELITHKNAERLLKL